jgi:Endonuclease/Exonuclease/phosphatase family
LTRFLFWNFHVRNDTHRPEAVLARIVLSHKVDLVMLAECNVPQSTILDELNGDHTSYSYLESPNRRFRIFASFPGEFLEPFDEVEHMCVWQLRLPAMQEVSLAMIHFPDRRNHPPDEQRSIAFGLADFLRRVEARAGHRRTVLVGDFNMNHFETGIVDIKCFGAMMTRSLARKHARDDPEQVPRFYNPMWSRFGDLSAGPPGTYYHRQSGYTNTYWHTLDQVLIRPDLIRAFKEDSLQVLTKVPSEGGEIDLIREKRKHWEVVVSDHLPLLFEMNLFQDLTHE